MEQNEEEAEEWSEVRQSSSSSSSSSSSLLSLMEGMNDNDMEEEEGEEGEEGEEFFPFCRLENKEEYVKDLKKQLSLINNKEFLLFAEQPFNTKQIFQNYLASLPPSRVIIQSDLTIEKIRNKKPTLTTRKPHRDELKISGWYNAWSSLGVLTIDKKPCAAFDPKLLEYYKLDDLYPQVNALKHEADIAAATDWSKPQSYYYADRKQKRKIIFESEIAFSDLQYFKVSYDSLYDSILSPPSRERHRKIREKTSLKLNSLMDVLNEEVQKSNARLEKNKKLMTEGRVEALIIFGGAFPTIDSSITKPETRSVTEEEDAFYSCSDDDDYTYSENDDNNNNNERNGSYDNGSYF